jgi:hypothetical protein
MSFQIQVVSPDMADIGRTMSRYPQQLDKGMEEATRASLLTLQESVPSYPGTPAGSTYRRTGTLGRTLGAGGGSPDIFQTRKLGSGFEGRFGSRLNYAPYVIGDGTQARWMGHWWALSEVARRAKPKIERIWNMLAEAMKRFVERKGV